VGPGGPRFPSRAPLPWPSPPPSPPLPVTQSISPPRKMPLFLRFFLGNARNLARTDRRGVWLFSRWLASAPSRVEPSRAERRPGTSPGRIYIPASASPSNILNKPFWSSLYSVQLQPLVVWPHARALRTRPCGPSRPSRQPERGLFLSDVLNVLIALVSPQH